MVMETTALGAAYLAGLAAGILPEPEVFGERWALGRRFTPVLGAEAREKKHQGWKDAVRRTRSTN
jgi:glycerol kinase